MNFSEGIDISKTNVSKKRIICHYWYFLNFDGMPAIDIMMY